MDTTFTFVNYSDFNSRLQELLNQTKKWGDLKDTSYGNIKKLFDDNKKWINADNVDLFQKANDRLGKEFKFEAAQRFCRETNVFIRKVIKTAENQEPTSTTVNEKGKKSSISTNGKNHEKSPAPSHQLIKNGSSSKTPTPSNSTSTPSTFLPSSRRSETPNTTKPPTDPSDSKIPSSPTTPAPTTTEAQPSVPSSSASQTPVVESTTREKKKNSDKIKEQDNSSPNSMTKKDENQPTPPAASEKSIESSLSTRKSPPPSGPTKKKGVSNKATSHSFTPPPSSKSETPDTTKEQHSVPSNSTSHPPVQSAAKKAKKNSNKIEKEKDNSLPCSKWCSEKFVKKLEQFFQFTGETHKELKKKYEQSTLSYDDLADLLYTYDSSKSARGADQELGEMQRKDRERRNLLGLSERKDLSLIAQRDRQDLQDAISYLIHNENYVNKEILHYYKKWVCISGGYPNIKDSEVAGLFAYDYGSNLHSVRHISFGSAEEYEILAEMYRRYEGLSTIQELVTANKSSAFPD